MIQAILTAVVVTTLLTPVVMALAGRVGLIDRPNTRSSHSIPTPRSGGIAILAGTAAALLYSARTDGSLQILFVAAAAIAVTGLADDLWNLRADIRLAVQFAAAAYLVVHGWVFAAIDPAFSIGGPLTVVMSAVWLAGLTNAYNFMDGVNGIASLEAIIAGGAMGFLFLRSGDVAAAVVAFALAGAAAGFLPWNFPRARVFMGDVASGALGFAFAALVLRYSSRGGSAVAATLPLLPFIADTTVTLVRRAAAGERLFAAHRSHFYQRLAATGWSHTGVTSLWGGLALMGVAGAVIYEGAAAPVRAAILIGVAAVLAMVGAIITVREQALR